MHALKGEDLGRRLFRFAVIADTHVNPEDARSSSPFATNALANERARYAIAEINRHEPAFVVHVGDLVHPVPELPSFVPSCERFKELASALKAPLHLVSGNHDVGDKKVDWMPAGAVTQEFVEQYRRIFGPDFFSFDAEGCHCIVVNAQVMASGLPAEAEQRAWLEADFEEHKGKRTFFFTHYPPYVSERGEASSYDNIDEPARTWLLDLLAKYKPEALFAGHVHHQWYDLFAETEMYILPSTAFVRQDYTELFKVPPGGPEYGRDESPKLGWYLVDVHERGHVAHYLRMDGRRLPADAARLADAPNLPPVHSKTNPSAPLGVDLRHAWVEWMDIAATGGVQEFERKHTRNDYPVVALWETGARKARVPLQDLVDPKVRARMALLSRLGHRFTAYVFGVPTGEALEALHAHGGVLDALEVVLPMAVAEASLPKLADLRKRLGRRVLVSKMRMHEDAKFDGAKFNHFINHGFVAAEREQVAGLVAASKGVAFDGVVLRVVRARAPAEAIPEARDLAVALGTKAAVHVRLAGDNPADPEFDELANANRVAEAMVAAWAAPEVEVFLDSFVDVDRGYFPHGGLVDRRYDPRLAGRVMRHLHAALGGARAIAIEGVSADAAARRLDLRVDGERWQLVLPATAAAKLAVPAKEHVDLGAGLRRTGNATSSGAPLLVRLS